MSVSSPGVDQIHFLIVEDGGRFLCQFVVKMTLILGTAAGFVFGVIGAIGGGKLAFGLISLVGMFMAVNIAGVVGIVVPLISKSLGCVPHSPLVLLKRLSRM